MNTTLYEYILMGLLGLITVISWFGMRRAKAKQDMDRRKGWQRTMLVGIMFLVIVTIGQFVDIEKHQDAFFVIMILVAIFVGLAARAVGGRGSNGKNRNNKKK
jgi:cell division protein FtsW (lipid II flippase)